jgi:hypothetical protein
MNPYEIKREEIKALEDTLVILEKTIKELEVIEVNIPAGYYRASSELRIQYYNTHRRILEIMNYCMALRCQ